MFTKMNRPSLSSVCRHHSAFLELIRMSSRPSLSQSVTHSLRRPLRPARPLLN